MPTIGLKPGEQIMIGDDIVVTLRKIRDKSLARVNVQAPQAYRISRHSPPKIEIMPHSGNTAVASKRGSNVNLRQ